MEAVMEERPLDAAIAHTSDVVLPDVPTGMPSVSVADSSSREAKSEVGFSPEEMEQFEAEMHEFLRQQETPSEAKPAPVPVPVPAPEPAPEPVTVQPPQPAATSEVTQLPVAPVAPVEDVAQSYRRCKSKSAGPKPVTKQPPVAPASSVAPETAYRRKPLASVAAGQAETAVAAPHLAATAAPVASEEANPVDPENVTQQHANPIYERPIADHAVDSYRCIGIGASPIENDRQLVAAMSQHKQAATQRRVSAAPKRAVDTGLFSTITGYLGLAPAPAEEETEEASAAAKTAAEVRELKVRLSMDDPLLSVESRRAHQLFVQGASLTDLKAAGVRATHLLDIGVNYSAFETAGMGVRDLLFLEAKWEDIVAMGFQPVHIVRNRDKSGTPVLAAPPLSLTFDDLERFLGLSMDEAVYDLGMTCADFSILGENVASMVQRGFNKGHAQHMKEPPYNYTHALSATTEDVRFLFGQTETAAAASASDGRGLGNAMGCSRSTTHRSMAHGHMSTASEKGYLQLNTVPKQRAPPSGVTTTSKFKF